ncbi:TIGR01212 family radical SAM protein [Geobacter sp. SVR]|uniref:TIGR01212 family radical SAM protein n=1 Tax=Geobacter sp. SVR TaxID=2495594 RepID=UPI00143F043D|nr:TIGR01212 family radical SAM protein [Geobacter sp. SVR]BCS55575.1 TIGR01212 family radical SAM protein [Geobacter sp. SVR]GCF83578.1 TIGR01212 family radical SAM protein [Geobacter sp. SVR]
MSSPKRYNPFSDELKRVFGCKVQRISVDAGFTCPNRDGTLGRNGCIFCGGHGSGSHGIKRGLGIADQLEDGKEVMIRKYRAARFLAYFQAFSNTYAPVAHLRSLFEQALAVPDVVGLIIATRPDCLSDDVLDYLGELNRRCYLWLELGVQTMHDGSLARINRGHDHACSAAAIERARQRGLRVCAHLILGVPGETREDILASVAEMNRLGVDGVKLHLLHVMKGTRLAEMHGQGRVELLDRDGYAGLVCDVLERLDPAILIHRLTGDGGHDNLVAPLWSLKKFEVLNLIDAELERRGTRQGDLLSTLRSPS